MKVLAFDSGATRAGWAVLEDGPVYIASDVEHRPRPATQAYQAYRMELTEFWAFTTRELLDEYKPTLVITETVPVVGMNNFSQGYLANVMATTVHVVAMMADYNVEQVSARSVQKNISVRGKTKNVTKPQVRNGVLSLLPELKETFKQNMKIFEESDAVAIGLYTLGYKVG